MNRLLSIALVTLLFASAQSFASAQIPHEGETYALLVGVSSYRKLPRDLWLQYADADATTLRDHLASPRGGGVPAQRILLLTNERATTPAIRDAFQNLARIGVGRKDTVVILIAGHGTVDKSGAYILTYESDPENLAATAFPMAELHSLVKAELSKAGHVIFLADVCRAAAIAGQKTSSLAAAVETIGEAPGELLGLMAARPTELSLEGPEFGGGHGAFTYSLLKGLEGAADLDRDGFVTAGELIDFVTTDVPRLARNRQHPRDFGNMENSTRLSNLSLPGIDLPGTPQPRHAPEK
jgi:uncharacterized caspase-like protein